MGQEFLPGGWPAPCDAGQDHGRGWIQWAPGLGWKALGRFTLRSWECFSVWLFFLPGRRGLPHNTVVSGKLGYSESKVEAIDILGSYVKLFLPYSLDKENSQGPPRFEGRRKGLCLLVGRTAGSHCKGTCGVAESRAAILGNKSTTQLFTSLPVQITLQIVSFTNFYMGGRMNSCRIPAVCRVLC